MTISRSCERASGSVEVLLLAVVVGVCTWFSWGPPASPTDTGSDLGAALFSEPAIPGAVVFLGHSAAVAAPIPCLLPFNESVSVKGRQQGKCSVQSGNPNQCSTKREGGTDYSCSVSGSQNKGSDCSVFVGKGLCSTIGGDGNVVTCSVHRLDSLPGPIDGECSVFAQAPPGGSTAKSRALCSAFIKGGGFCSVRGEAGGPGPQDGTCSVLVVTTGDTEHTCSAFPTDMGDPADRRCSVSIANSGRCSVVQTATNISGESPTCSVMGGGGSTEGDGEISKCSISKQRPSGRAETYQCSVVVTTEGTSARCSAIIAGSGRWVGCSAGGSDVRGNTDAQCSVTGKSISGECSVYSREPKARCSVFSPPGDHRCSVMAGSNGRCTVFKGVAKSQCSVIGKGTGTAACSVHNDDGSSSGPDANGACERRPNTPTKR